VRGAKSLDDTLPPSPEGRGNGRLPSNVPRTANRRLSAERSLPAEQAAQVAGESRDTSPCASRSGELLLLVLFADVEKVSPSPQPNCALIFEMLSTGES
jgi:hypothetical protein